MQPCRKHEEKLTSRKATASAAFSGLNPDEQPAPVAILSPAERVALVTCLYGDGTLHKSRGVWTLQPATACNGRIYGITIADLARDGMLKLTVIGKSAFAQLTPRGSWFARSLAAEMSTAAMSDD